MYVTACVAALWMLAGRALRVDALAFAFLASVATYLLDRVKLRDADLDPSDTMSHPARAAFMRAHSRSMRALVALSALGAVSIALLRAPIAALLAPAALLGVAFYARSRTRYPWRPKDVLQLKNLSVAAAVTAFALALLLLFGDGPIVATLLDAAIPAVFLAQTVFADALLCDIDDLDADARFGTRTIPVRFGVRRAEFAALALKSASALWPALIALQSGITIPVGLVWVILPTPVALLAIRTCRGNYRDAVDLSMAPICLVSWIVASIV